MSAVTAVLTPLTSNSWYSWIPVHRLTVWFKSLVLNWSVHIQLEEGLTLPLAGSLRPPPPSQLLKWDRRGEALTMDWSMKKRNKGKTTTFCGRNSGAWWPFLLFVQLKCIRGRSKLMTSTSWPQLNVKNTKLTSLSLLISHLMEKLTKM